MDLYTYHYQYIRNGEFDVYYIQYNDNNKACM